MTYRKRYLKNLSFIQQVDKGMEQVARFLIAHATDAVKNVMRAGILPRANIMQEQCTL